MIKYEIDHGETHFSRTFKQIFCKFKYVIDPAMDDGKDEFFGVFVCDINWRGYFTDPILCRFTHTEAGSSWLKEFNPETQPLNDLMFNKIVEYMELARGKTGLALEIEDEEIHKVSSDHEQGDYFSEKQEEEIFHRMFNSIQFLEAFKLELANPQHQTLKDALEYFRESGLYLDDMQESVIGARFNKFLR